jgi:hypothetical protein
MTFRAPYMYLCRQRKVYAKAGSTERTNIRFGTGLLGSEIVAWNPNQYQTSLALGRPKALQSCILWGESAARRSVDN